ncbi:MAG: porin family protein [Pseudolabrys sp.]|nr:porin family protein [Pseudolabrys sp.]MBV9262522.1 porin family protein [Pseudolabrys sp.]
MKKLLLATASVMALATVSAHAADIARRPMPAKAPEYVAPIYNWTGFYVGINGGGGWGRSDSAAPFATAGSFNTSGGMVGGTVGYNWQMGTFVWGLEGDIDWSNIRGSAPCGATTCETRNDWLGTFRGRLGYAAGRIMPYITGGLAVGNINHNVVGVGSANNTRAGWALGGGVEVALWQNWTGKLEYLYADLGRGSSVLGSDAKFNASLLRAGLNYRF